MFLIQTGEDGQVLFDFQYELLERLRIDQWLHDDSSAVLLAQTFKNFVPPKDQFVCPVGSIEFVTDYIRKYHGDLAFKKYTTMTPINIPKQLTEEEFSGRFVKKYITLHEVLSILNQNPGKNYYVKSSTKIKDTVRFCYRDNAASSFAGTSEGDKFDISEDVGILRAEWRVFIYKGEILDVRMYIGDWSAPISSDFVESAVKAWTSKPPACVLDVALTDSGKYIVVEAHNFVSCGTYGFQDQHLPKMFAEGFKWELKM